MRKAETVSVDTVVSLSALLLVILFGYALSSKLNEHTKFAEYMKLVPVPLIQQYATVIAWAVPLAEAVTAIMLCLERWRKTGLVLAFLLLLVFEIYIAAMLLLGLELPCTCSGFISKLGWKPHLIFNAFFMFISVLPFLYQRHVTKKYFQIGPSDILRPL